MVDSSSPETSGKVRLAVVSGSSGSGKSVALRTLEDLGFYCIDNLPASLLPALAEHALGAGEARYPRVAVGIDARTAGGDPGELPRAFSQLAELGLPPFLVFLDARDEVLLKRFSETRRRHPLGCEGMSLSDAIARERVVLKPVKQIADAEIDTSELNVYQLRRRILEAMGISASGVSLMFESFAFKRGVPNEADFLFDARALPNPHWEPRLRPLSGRDAAVGEFFEGRPEVGEFIDDVERFLRRWLPRFDPSERSYLTIAIGCTGGRHRSVYIAERLQERFRQLGGEVLCFHRELA
ncbi:MAG: RNase adapter RapZ [Lysobacterales bacterium]